MTVSTTSRKRCSVKPIKTGKAPAGEGPDESREKTADNEPVVLQEAPHFDLNDSQWFLNRELTWLEFNRRILHEAEETRTPLLERLKFIAIVSANLDSFFMKRIGGFKQQIGAGMQELMIFDTQLYNRCAAWDMKSDGSVKLLKRNYSHEPSEIG